MSPAVAITTLGLLTNTTTTLYQHSTTPSQHHPRSLLLAGPKTFTLPRYLLESPNPSPPLPSVAVFQLFYCAVTVGRAKRFLFLAIFSCPLQHFYFHGKVPIWIFSSFFFFCPGQVTVLVADPRILLFIGSMSTEITGTSLLPT